MAEINLGRVVGPRGPQGEQGAAGPQGPAGADGAKGDPGPNQVSASTKTEGFEDGQALYSEGGFVRAKTLTASDVGALSPTGNDSNVTTEFTQASTRANLSTGEKLAVSLGKLMKWFADLKTVAFSGSYNDLTDKPTASSIGAFAKTDVIPVANGGTGANNAKEGLKKLGLRRKSYVVTTTEAGGFSLPLSDFGQSNLLGLVGVVYNKKAVIYWNEPTANGANGSLYDLSGNPIKNTSVRIHVIFSPLTDWS